MLLNAIMMFILQVSDSEIYYRAEERLRFYLLRKTIAEARRVSLFEIMSLRNPG